MMWLKFTIFCVLIHCSFSENDVKPNPKKFVPTNEWQVVEPGQHLPAGLHIRSDIYKGITEAKLLDPDCTDCVENPIQTYKDEDVLAKIGREFAEYDTQIRDEEASKQAFRSYEQIKAEMKKLNMTIEDDLNTINNLITRFEEIASEPNTDDQISIVLQDLEYLLHQIDNAQYFFKLNGLRRLIFRAVKHPNPEIQKITLRLLSAAVQHNPKVQLDAVNGDTVLMLYRLLQSEHQSVVISTLSAISNVIKKFPSAQLAFLRYGAFKTIFGLVKRKDYFDNPRFKNRVLTLMLDYYEDNQEDISDKVSAEHSKLVMSFFTDHFKADGWCEILKKFVDESGSDYEVMEKLFPLIYHTKTLCWDVYRDEKFKESLTNIIKFYDKAALREIEDVLLKHESGIDVDLDNLVYGELKEKLKDLFDMIYGKKIEHTEL